MKKSILWILLYLLMGLSAIAYASWTYDEMTAGVLSDLDELLWLDVSDLTSGAEGTVKRQTFATFKSELPFGKCFLIEAAVVTDDFLIWKAPIDITIKSINGVLQSGTNVVGGLDECDSNGTSCVAVDADITFNGNNDADDGSLSNSSIDAGDWVRWHTTSVSSPGFLTVCLDFK